MRHRTDPPPRPRRRRASHAVIWAARATSHFQLDDDLPPLVPRGEPVHRDGITGAAGAVFPRPAMAVENALRLPVGCRRRRSGARQAYRRPRVVADFTLRHGRAIAVRRTASLPARLFAPGHPRLCCGSLVKTWMPGTPARRRASRFSLGMSGTKNRNPEAELLRYFRRDVNGLHI